MVDLKALCRDEFGDEDFWADDSDTDDESIDNDPELVAERWDCLSCGLKNKPFVRYCGKCWQVKFMRRFILIEVVPVSYIHSYSVAEKAVNKFEDIV